MPDRADQNAACELNPNSESPQALSRVRARTFRGRRRTGPATVGTGPVPSGCHCTVTGPGGTSRPGSRTAGAVMSCAASGFGEGPGRPVVAGRVGSPGGGELLLTPRACAASTMVGVSVASHGEPSVHPWLCRRGPGPVAGLLLRFHRLGKSITAVVQLGAGPVDGRRRNPAVSSVTNSRSGRRVLRRSTGGMRVAVTPVAWGNALPRVWFRCGHAQKRKLDEDVLL